MAYSEPLADRIRWLLQKEKGVSERKMFGGIAFLISGNMCCGIVGNDLMLRLGNDLADSALAEPFTRPMDFTGRPLRSMIYVDAEGVASEVSLAHWIDMAVAYARTIPPKKKSPPKANVAPKRESKRSPKREPARAQESRPRPPRKKR